MSTIGHPLSDLCNLTMPFFLCRKYPAVRTAHPGFQPGAIAGMPTLEQIHGWYATAAGWSYTSPERAWGMCFSVFRIAAVCQGIAARVARRQASSAEARDHAKSMHPLAEFAFELAKECEKEADAEVEKDGEKERARL